eukprot:SAG11_NODE_29896_length_306_cov_0.739130_1_plen_36_part_10
MFICSGYLYLFTSDVVRDTATVVYEYGGYEYYWYEL